MSEGILISGSADKTLRVWDMATHQCKGVLEGHDGWIRSVQLNGYQIISGSGDHTAKLWDISRLEVTGVPLLDNQDDVDEPLLKTYYGHSAGITCLQFEQGRLLTGSIDKTIRSFDMETGGTLSVLYAMKPLESSQLDTILYPESKSDSPFSDLLSNKDFTGWSETNGNAPALIPRNNCGHVGGLHFYQHALAAGYGDGQIRLFDLRTGKCHRQLIEHSMAVTAVNFDDNEIISGSLDNTIKVNSEIR
jgi:WD40 repeat protein